MTQKNITVALDIGTTKVCTLIAQDNPDQEHNLEIIGVGSHPSYGLKKGSVINIDKTIRSIRCSLEEAKLMAGLDEIKTATIGIAGNHIYCFNSTGVIPISGPEVTEADVSRVVEAAKAVLIPSDREVLHVIAQEYRVDSTSGVRNPVGMCGSRLEAHVHIVTGKTPLIQNLVKCVESCSLDVDEILLQPIASSSSVLTLEEKELGVVLVDIGGGTTDIAIWRDSGLVHSQIIPVGGNHFTNDLAVALRIPHAEAERVKVNHGSVFPEQISETSHVTVNGLSGTRPKEVTVREIAEVLGSRAEELFGIINDMIIEKDLAKSINGGFVITGGGALIKGMAEIGEYTLSRPVKIGYPQPFGGMTTVMQNPKFSTALGLLIESKRSNKVQNKVDTQRAPSSLISGQDLFARFGQSVRNVFKEIF